MLIWQILLQIRFNSIKVRLIPHAQTQYENKRVFQFHKGSINTWCWCGVGVVLVCFNSIKVRLIHWLFALAVIVNVMFQFHKGSINTELGLCVARGLVSCFNSIKVRLILSMINNMSENSAFQFHKGSINTHLILSTSLLRSSFNSIKVRLIPQTCRLMAMSLTRFNSIKVRLIPFWCW